MISMIRMFAYIFILTGIFLGFVSQGDIITSSNILTNPYTGITSGSIYPHSPSSVERYVYLGGGVILICFGIFMLRRDSIDVKVESSRKQNQDKYIP